MWNWMVDRIQGMVIQRMDRGCFRIVNGGCSEDGLGRSGILEKDMDIG